MTSPPRPTRSLARQTLLSLAGLFLMLELVSVGAIVALVMAPMAERAAEDLAAMMVLSAQVWSELPPQTRPAFERELREAHQMAVQTDAAAPQEAIVQHGLYLWFLEQALQRRMGAEVPLLASTAADGERWMWATLPGGGVPVRVGFAESRLGTHPLAVLGLLLVGATGLAVAGAGWMARRIARPVAQLDHATAEMAEGRNPAPLPETGPMELARLSARFNRMTEQVRGLIEARTTLFAGLSHDLRTPLARMRLALEMLRLRPGDPTLIDRLDRDVESMNGLIGQLLELARGLDHGEQVRVDLPTWVRDRVALQSGAIAASGSSLQVRDAGPVALRLDAPALGRVFDNLLGNALRYAPGPIDVVVEARGQGGARVGVLDRGPGIPEAAMPAVWQPFHRLEPSRSAQTGGFGLGLAVVRQLAQAHGWAVTLQAREGGGLAAWVELPATS